MMITYVSRVSRGDAITAAPAGAGQAVDTATAELAGSQTQLSPQAGDEFAVGVAVLTGTLERLLSMLRLER